MIKREIIQNFKQFFFNKWAVFTLFLISLLSSFVLYFYYSVIANSMMNSQGIDPVETLVFGHGQVLRYMLMIFTLGFSCQEVQRYERYKTYRRLYTSPKLTPFKYFTLKIFSLSFFGLFLISFLSLPLFYICSKYLNIYFCFSLFGSFLYSSLVFSSLFFTIALVFKGPLFQKVFVLLIFSHLVYFFDKLSMVFNNSMIDKIIYFLSINKHNFYIERLFLSFSDFAFLFLCLAVGVFFCIELEELRRRVR